ncbi:stage II sporulation protein P [Lottiidibacillus patelloidae]|uniref:Stage II sporulation protein P n=1 Tax=Lottiidibacillus patelloidae TaxID=2670334 RepID=A0A263BVM8_9BACI|nr:stage II sporulation protein P [Lottiidibacillus patelloidae]OZM57760.1 stage II sporulation protein P [Lottiidibacillus patelloidae]
MKKKRLHLRNGLHRWIAIFIVGVISLFLVIGSLTSIDGKYRLGSSSIKQWATNFSGETLMYLFGAENRYFTQVLAEETKPPALTTVLFELATNIKPNDPRSLLGRELPGFAFFDSKIIVAGQGTDYTTLPIESPPPIEDMLIEREASIDDVEDPEDTPITPPSKTTEGRKVVYIYHTHSRESFLPHLPEVKNIDQAYHSEVNITLVGERLGKEFERRGIGAIVETRDIQQIVKDQGKKWNQSYDVSRSIIQEAVSQNSDIKFIFDLHRDSHRRDVTTVTIDGETYARTFFVLGGENANYEENEQMALKLHEMLQKKYPGLSRGSVVRKGTGVNGIYNQDISDYSILIEIGGVDNSLEETYRTAEALADIISEYYWEIQGASRQ